eukprot:1157912-Pelagomonas_calceolata.AAC.8
MIHDHLDDLATGGHLMHELAVVVEVHKHRRMRRHRRRHRYRYRRGAGCIGFGAVPGTLSLRPNRETCCFLAPTPLHCHMQQVILIAFKKGGRLGHEDPSAPDKEECPRFSPPGALGSAAKRQTEGASLFAALPTKDSQGHLRSDEAQSSLSESLIETGLLSDEELDSCIVSNFNPIRVGFKGGPEDSRAALGCLHAEVFCVWEGVGVV